MFHYFKIPYFTCKLFTRFTYNEYIGPYFLSHVVLRISPSVLPEGESHRLSVSFFQRLYMFVLETCNNIKISPFNLNKYDVTKLSVKSFKDRRDCGFDHSLRKFSFKSSLAHRTLEPM